MRANEIRAELIRRGIKVSTVASSLGIAAASVSQVVAGVKSTRYVQEYIAAAIGLSWEKVFPVDKEPKC